MKKLVHFKTVMVLLVGLAGCGGGGDSGGSGGGGTGNTQASVNAGADQSVNEQLQATVSATGFPDGGTYAWTQTAGPVLTGFPATGQSVTITAPIAKSEETVTLRVEYTTTDGKIVDDTVNIMVQPVNRAPVAIASQKTPTNNPVAPDETVVLDGSASFDQDADGSIVAYKWEQGEGSPLVSQLNGSTSQEFHFVSPQVNNVTELPFKLTVTDDEGEEAEYEMSVTVDPTLTVVSVDGGADQIVNEEQTVSMTANGNPSGGTFTWSQQSGDSLSNFPFTGQTATFTAPTTKTVTDYEFRVQYQSPTGYVAYDQVRITVNPVNLQPNAVVRVLSPALLPAKPAELVTLDGSASTDSDGSIVSYRWTQISGSQSISSENGNESAEFKFRAPVQTTPESYVFRLTVTDDEGGQGSFDMTIDIEGTSDIIVADAGADQLVNEFSTVTLDGQNSFSSISAITCSWRQVSGPTVSFTNPDQCISTFVAPNVDINTDLVMELKVTNSNDDSATDTIKVTVQPIPLGKMVDSGQTACYNQSSEVPCGDSSYPRQDGDYGRDAVAGFLDKVGSGASAFDYTKLDANGDEVADDASDYACIRDNFTGLIWEIKTTSANPVPNTTLRDNKNTYNWHYPDGSTGGETGEASDAGTTCPSTDDCGMETYVKAVNESVYCGGANWRVPTMVELQSIVDYSKGSSTGAVDTNIFNDLPAQSLQQHLYYWSSETIADGGGKEAAWVLNYVDGNDNSLPKASNAYVRLVRKP